mgnify:CR=1 FL=1
MGDGEVKNKRWVPRSTTQGSPIGEAFWARARFLVALVDLRSVALHLSNLSTRTRDGQRP